MLFPVTRAKTDDAAPNIVECMTDDASFAPWFHGEDLWFGWRCILKAAFALPMDDRELVFFQSPSRTAIRRKQGSASCGSSGTTGGKDRIAS